MSAVISLKKAIKMKIQIHLYIFITLISFSKVTAQNFEVDGVKYNILNTTEVEVSNKPECYTGDIVIPETVENLGVIYSVTAIGINAFYQCNGLTSINLPDSVTEIKSQAFLECTNLSSINFTSSISAIGYMAFRNCTSLLSIDLSATILTEIGGYAFLRCENTVSIILPNTLESIGDNVFHYCESLTQINIPNTVKSIGTRAFAYSGLTSIDIPSSVTLIDNYAFEVCRGMKTVNVPSSVTSIGDYAFYGNYTLEAFNIDIQVPLAITTSVFQGRNLSLVTLSVPVGSDSAYSTASIWQDFGTINGTLSTNYLEKELVIKLFPNPATTNISITGLSERSSYNVYDVVGKPILKGTLLNGNSINIENLSSGLYFLKLKNREAIKFIKP